MHLEMSQRGRLARTRRLATRINASGLLVISVDQPTLTSPGPGQYIDL